MSFQTLFFANQNDHHLLFFKNVLSLGKTDLFSPSRDNDIRLIRQIHVKYKAK